MSTPNHSRSKRVLSRLASTLLMLIIVVVLFITAILLLFGGSNTNTTSAKPLNKPIPTQTPPTPATPTPTAKPSKNSTTYATLTVPSAHIKNLAIVRNKGVPDDLTGTLIQNTGVASAPYGSWGGVEPGLVGNFFLAAHRTSDSGPMYDVPNLKPGDKILVKKDNTTYTYIVAYQLWINFREKDSRAEQTAAVPGYPGIPATSPAIVLSTCATAEDKAAGLYWFDANNNPTHRFAVVGFLKDSQPASVPY